LFGTTLPTGVAPVFPSTLNVEGGLQPFTETVALEAITRCVLSVNEFPYSLAPQSDAAAMMTRTVFAGSEAFFGSGVLMTRSLLSGIETGQMSLMTRTIISVVDSGILNLGNLITRSMFVVATSSGSSSSVLTLAFEGTNTSTTFTDLSASARTVTAHGNAQVSTAQFKSGSASLYCNTAGSFAFESYASVASDSVFTITSGVNFELLASYRISASDATTRSFALIISEDLNQSILITDNAGAMSVDIYVGGTPTHSVSITAPTLTWHDVSVKKVGTTLTIKVNGTQVLSATAASLPWAFSYTGMRIGAIASTNSAYWWIDDFSFSIL
jgi:hypothetical protein